MGEDVDEKQKLFELPSDGDISLPVAEQSSDPEIEQIISDATAVAERSKDHLRIKLDPATYRFDFGSSGSVYIKTAHQQSYYSDKTENSHLIYAIDLDNSGQVMGSALSIFHSDYGGEENHPFVGWNQTKARFYRQGLSLRRLIVLNEMCKQLYGDKLTSSGIFVDRSPENPAIKTWESLARVGLIEKTEPGYRFVK
jgi:hypothetical protein